MCPVVVAEAPADVDRLGRLALDLGSASEPLAIYRLLRDFVRDSTSMNGFFIASYDSETQLRTCVFAHTDGIEIDPATLPPLPMNGSPNSRAIQTREIVLVEDYEAAVSQSGVTYVGSDVDPTRPRCSLVVPMVAHGHVLGTMTIQSPRERAFGERDVAYFRMATNLAALAVENLALLARERQHRATLEARVAERTQELDAAYGHLREHAVARDLVRRLLQGVSRKGRVRPEVLRALGRELAKGMEGASMEEYAAAFELMGLGGLRLSMAAPPRYALEGRNLLEREHAASQPTCFLTLGFLEGAVAALHLGAVGLGTEVACQSQGYAACRFVVAAR